MGLLRWCTLQPQGPSNLAAILFPAPVRLSSIRVFPTGAQPFSQCPDIVALTEPEAFFLDVFFNTSSIQSSNQESPDKRAPKNELAPTRIVYPGGQVDYEVDMGPEYATRLVIIKGEYRNLSLAIYGNVVADVPPVETYEAKPLPTVQSAPLSSVVHPMLSTKPTMLADQLLTLMSQSPPLSLVIRLMFCLKPTDEDWDHPDFPFLYSDLEKEDEDFDLESLVQATSRPIRDDASEESLTRFASRVNDFIGSKTSDEVYYVAKLLSILAPQHHSMSKILLEHVDLASMLDEENMDEATILCFFDAAANVEISRSLSGNETFMQILQAIKENGNTAKPTLTAVKRLEARMDGWKAFENAFLGAEADYSNLLPFLRDMSSEEFSTGCWLECMLNHDTFSSKISEETISLSSTLYPPLLLQGDHFPVSQAEFIGFTRAMVAITSILAVCAWADSNGKDACRERALGILALWQGVDGYREIVNHCLLLRQLTRRLGWITKENDPPRKSCILAERLLVGLTKDPQAMLREDLFKAILSLEPPFCSIEEDELLEMGKLAKVARDGLSSAIEELTFSSVRPLSLRRLRVLRISLAIVRKELDDDDREWLVLETFWTEGSQGFLPRLVALLADISDDLIHHFEVQPIPQMNQALTELLFRTANDSLQLIGKLASAYPLTSRDLRNLTIAVADLFVCSSAVIVTFSSTCVASIAAKQTKEECSAIMHDLTISDIFANAGTPAALVVLRSLLEHATQSDHGTDPVYHLQQTYTLIENVLPDPSSLPNASLSHWVMLVFPKILQELNTFCHHLDPSMHARFIERLVQLDNGETGVGDWLITEEVKRLSITLHEHSVLVDHDELQLVLQYQINTLIRLCESLVTSPAVSSWFLTSFSTNPDSSYHLEDCFSTLLDGYYSSPSLTNFVKALASHAEDFDPSLRFHILLHMLRILQTDVTGFDLGEVIKVLRSLPSTSVTGEPLRTEVGPLLSAYAEYPGSISSSTADHLLQMLEWLSLQENTKLTSLAGISADSFSQLCSSLMGVLPTDRQTVLPGVEMKFTIDEDDPVAHTMTYLPDKLTLPLQSIENLLSQPFVPSTPKGTKTPDVLGVVISPPTAVLRSPAATGLTKTYANNDFRQLRQVASTRLNTSRLPSTHVDVGINEFQHPLPELLPAFDASGMAFMGVLPGNL